MKKLKRKKVEIIDRTPKTGLNITGFGGQYLQLTNYGRCSLMFEPYPGAPQVEISPREVCVVHGSFLAQAHITLKVSTFSGDVEAVARHMRDSWPD